MLYALTLIFINLQLHVRLGRGSDTRMLQLELHFKIPIIIAASIFMYLGSKETDVIAL